MFEIPEYNGIGVYAIINDTNGKIYVGSSVNVANRIKSHNTSIRFKNYNAKMLADIEKGHTFHVEILEKIEDGITRNELRKREIYYAEKHNSFKGGYNSGKIGTVESTPINYYKNRSDNKSQEIFRGIVQYYLTPLYSLKSTKKQAVVLLIDHAPRAQEIAEKKRGFSCLSDYINHLIYEDMVKGR